MINVKEKENALKINVMGKADVDKQIYIFVFI